jgi:hypothetical protein
MATTTYKGFELQATGANSGTWGSVLNSDVFQIIDNNLGAITTKALTNVNVTLSASESQSAILRLSGTLTGNVQITTSCYGFFFVENLTTGSFTVTITNGAGSSFVAPQGARSTVISDSTNGIRAADTSLIPSGSVMIFVQTTAPAGWTKSVAHNNKALRIVSGAASSGGSTDFTSVFTSRTIAEANLPSHTHGPGTLTTSGGSAHSHVMFSASLTPAVTLSTSTQYATYSWNPGGATSYSMRDGTDAPTLAKTANESSHTHTMASGVTASTGSGTAMDFAVAYVDCILATKD